MKGKLVPVPETVIKPNKAQYRRIKEEGRNRQRPLISKEELANLLAGAQKVTSSNSGRTTS